MLDVAIAYQGMSAFAQLVAHKVTVKLLRIEVVDGLEGETFAFETTLSTRSYVKLIQQAQKRGYFVTLLFFALATPEQAVQRVAKRVSQGGHNIPTDVVYRRFEGGLSNLFNLYMPIVDYWALYDNSNIPTQHIASGELGKEPVVLQKDKFEELRTKYKTEDEQKEE